MGKPRILLALLALGQATCNQAILTAPAGSSLTVFANPDVIASNGGVSVISVLIVEPAGTVVADGTVVQFFTDLGDIAEQGKTNDGVARVNLQANGRSGLATITAVSGGDAPTPSPSATAGTGVADVGAAASSIGPAASASGATKVTIGNLAAVSLLLTADPPRISTPRGEVQIRANVFDADGNPLAGVPVFFSVSVSGTGTASATMDSGGTPRFTDSNGQAFDVMRTKTTAPGTNTATVVARVPTGTAGVSDKFEVQIVAN